ncbi:MAG: hypothetical protein ABMB14_19155 [Myxococcota bacterium]
MSDREREQREAEAAAQLAREQASAARGQLLTDLVAVASEIGVVKAARDADGLTLRYGERYLYFGPEGELDRVKIEFEGIGDEEHVLFRQPELANRWVYSRKRRHREDRVPLFDAGLEELLVRGLGLPRPGEEDDPAPSSPDRKRL